MKTMYHDIGLLILRVLTGLGMATHGYGKVFTPERMEGFIDGVAALGFPIPLVFAWAAALAELVGGLLLAAGAFTRYAAFFIFCTMTVAAFIRHAGDPFSTRELALLYWSVTLAIIFLGSGRYAVDQLIRSRK